MVRLAFSVVLVRQMARTMQGLAGDAEHKKVRDATLESLVKRR